MHKIHSLLLICFIFVFDQLSKWAVTEHVIRPALSEAPPLGLGEWLFAATERLPFTSIEILPFFNIVMVWNQGVSFGMFNNLNAYGPMILSIVSVLISIIFAIWLIRSTSRLQSLALCLVIAGALGNVIDRVRFGAVIDFLDVHAAGYHWPAFNIADSAICIGVFLLIIHAIFFETAGNSTHKSATTDSENSIN